MNEANKFKKNWYLRPWGIFFLTILFIFFIFIFGFVFLVIDTIKNPPKQTFKEAQIDEETLKQIMGENEYHLGGENPKVTIVEFADFACPACKASSAKLRNLNFKYKKDLKIIFRDYPVIADYSIDLSKAAHCAGEQNLFWLMHDKLFENQSISEKEDIFKIAAEISVDGSKFTTCFDNDKYKNKILKNYSDGLALGIKGTPTFFVNGERIVGDVDLETWGKIIDYIIQK